MKTNKTERIDIRATKSESRRIKRAAKKYNLSTSEYILKSVLYSPNYYKRELDFINASTAFQSLINDIRDGIIDLKDTQKCQEELDKIWKTL